MSINQEWTIQNRAEKCAVTGTRFADGEYFYTLLYDEPEGMRREDLSEAAWKERNDNRQPFSFWRSKFEVPPAGPPETVTKQTAEDLLRRYMEESSPQHAAARYLLAAMLERKRLLKEVESKQLADGQLARIYEHTKTGEVFVIPDPGLRLDQIEQVQQEVAALLSPSPLAAAAQAQPAPEPRTEDMPDKDPNNLVDSAVPASEEMPNLKEGEKKSLELSEQAEHSHGTEREELQQQAKEAADDGAESR